MGKNVVRPAFSLKLTLSSGNTGLCTNLKKRLNPTINISNNRLSSSDDHVFDSSGNTTADATTRPFAGKRMTGRSAT